MDTEKRLQAMCVKYLRANQRIVFTHPYNETETPPTKGKRFAFANHRHRQGLTPGIPDILIFNDNEYYNGLAIELKIKRNKPTEKQIDWLQRLTILNWFAIWVNDFDDFVDIVNKYLHRPGHLRDIGHAVANNGYYYPPKALIMTHSANSEAKDV